MTQATTTMPTTSNGASNGTQASRHGTSAAVTAASVHPTIPMTVGPVMVATPIPATSGVA